jgi:membrane protein implicated in regulation of membrane protease activity
LPYTIEVRRVGIVVAALLGFAAGAFLTFIVGAATSVSADCDGPCFSTWDEMSYVAYAVGVLSAVLFGILANRLLKKKPHHGNGDGKGDPLDTA